MRILISTLFIVCALLPTAAWSQLPPAFCTMWGSLGAGQEQFDHPFGVAIDASGNVYVADANNNRIQVFTSSGGYVTQWGGYGSGQGQFYSPYGVAVDASGNVYVMDTGNNRIQMFTGSGGYITQWGSSGSGQGQFNYPGGIAVDASGNVYVADTQNYRIQGFCYVPTAVENTTWGRVKAMFR